MAAILDDLNHEALRGLKREIRRFFTAPERRRGFLMIGLLGVGLLVINGLNVLNSYVGRDFISAIEHRDTQEWIHQTWLYLGVLGLSTLVVSINRLMEERLGLLWRRWLTRALLDNYFGSLVYHRLEVQGDLPNPDQRITEDVRTFTTTTLSFFLLALNAAITVFSFSGVLWSISPELLLGAVLYALTGSFLTYLVGRRLIDLNVQQLDCEANLRSELMHVRQSAEPLALTRREEHLHRRVLRRLDLLVQNTRRIIRVDLRVGLFTNGYNYLLQIIPALIVAPLFIHGQVEFGVITQSAMAFAFLSGAFSLIVTQFQSISTYTAVVVRLSRLVERMESIPVSVQVPLQVLEQGQELCFDHLYLRGADGAVLLKDLNLTVRPGTHLLVASVSGHAKVALFRAIGGVDGRFATGRIQRPAARHFVLIPERPYLPVSSLRELLACSDVDGLPDDAELLPVLNRLQLQAVVEEAGGLDTEHDWNRFVGISEQIRLLIARVLVMRPLFVFMDRIWSVLDAVQMERVLQLLQGHEITCIMLSRPDYLPDQFDTVLEIERDGGWRVRPLSTPKATLPAASMPSERSRRG